MIIVVSARMGLKAREIVIFCRGFDIWLGTRASQARHSVQRDTPSSCTYTERHHSSGRLRSRHGMVIDPKPFSKRQSDGRQACGTPDGFSSAHARTSSSLSPLSRSHERRAPRQRSLHYARGIGRPLRQAGDAHSRAVRCLTGAALALSETSKTPPHRRIRREALPVRNLQRTSRLASGSRPSSPIRPTI